MSTPVRFYPPLKKLVTKDDLPLGLGFFESSIQSLIDGLFYRDFQHSAGSNGASNFYSLTIISYEELGFEIPGTGIKVLLNADPQPQEIGTFVPIKVYYRWPILQYVKDFDISNFSFSPEAFFQLGMYLIGGASHRVMKAAMNAFVGENDLPGFVQALNQELGLQLTQPSGTPDEQILLLTQQVEQSYGTSAAALIFSVFVVGQATDGDVMGRLNKLFSQLIEGNTLENYIKSLLIPRIEASMVTKVVVEFPRGMLIPLNETPGLDYGTPLPGNSRLLFEAGELQFSTEGGITLTGPPSADFQMSQIGETGFTIDFDDVNIDLSKKTNIPQATADGRPDDFIGVFIKDVSVGLPSKWFKKDNQGSTAEIFGESLLLGTGGISGTVGLRAAGQVPQGQDPVLKFKLAKNDGFEVGFRRFDLSFKQSAITGSNIKGYLKIPGFKDASNQDAQMDIDVNFAANGDFSITASEADGFEIRIPDVLSFTISSLSIGRTADDFFIAISGKLKFLNSAIASILEGDFEIKKLIIYSDGNIELEGGKLPLPKGAQIQLGPAKVAITAIHFGSHQQKHRGIERKYRYFGFDGGISLNPGGVDARGDGIKFYFTVDNDEQNTKPLHVFLRIQSLAIDLIIPGTASPEAAVALIKGYIKLKDSQGQEEYAGGVEFKLPKARIAGGAQMAYQPSEPAFIIDANLELPSPLPLGATGLGVYGFRGLLGLRYIASKQKAGLTDDASWYDYYKKPPLGTHIDKFAPPAETEDASNPFSIGAGASLATAADDGKAFSSKLFLLLSIPNLILLEGKANVLGKRVGLDSKDPPFFAFIALSPDSVEIGFGADYKIPTDSGKILDLQAAIQGGFFFRNPSAWYLHFGTKEKPIKAKILSLFDAKAFLMLSASGIETGARVEFKFDKKYAGGIVKVKVDVYLEIGGKISFEQPQIGGFILVGGGIDAFFLFIGFNFRIDTTLFAEAPKPFLIKGSLRLCVGITIGFWKFKKRIEKCFRVEFVWELDKTQDTTPLFPISEPKTEAEKQAQIEAQGFADSKTPIKAINMASGEGFDLVYFKSTMPDGTHADFQRAIIPLDSWIDIEFSKGLLPDAVTNRIAGRAAPPRDYKDLIPPEKVNRQVSHQYSLQEIRVLTWDGSNWQEYHPYKALANPAALAGLNAEPDKYKLGHWQKVGKQYNKVRLLADTSFSYLEQGEAAWVRLEELGHTASTLFCEGSKRSMHCVNWTDVDEGTDYDAGRLYHHNKLLYRVQHGASEVIPFSSPFHLPHSLVWDNQQILILDLDQDCVEVRLKLFSYAQGLRIKYFAWDSTLANPGYQLVQTRDYDRIQLLLPVVYDQKTPVRRIIIEPAHADRFKAWNSVPFGQGSEQYQSAQEASDCTLQEALLQVVEFMRQIMENPDESPTFLSKMQTKLQEAIIVYIEKRNIGCVRDDFDQNTLEEYLGQLQDLLGQLEDMSTSLSNQANSVCQLVDLLKEKQSVCLSQNPRPFAYQLYQEIDQDNIDEYRWRIIDREGNIQLSASTRYFSEVAAMVEMELAFVKAADWNFYEFKETSDHRFYFNILDSTGEVIGRRIQYFETYELAESIAQQMQQEFSAQLQSYQPALIPDAPDWRIAPPNVIEQSCLPGLVILMDQTPYANAFRSLILANGSPRPDSYQSMYALISQANQDLTHECTSLRTQQEQLEGQIEQVQEQLDRIQALYDLMDSGAYQRPEGKWHCSTLLQEVCWMRKEDWEFNRLIPGQDAIEADFQASRAAINRMLQPIWRPNGRYLVHFKLKDTVNGSSQPEDEKDYYFGFSTVGPLGHFHLSNGVNYVPEGKDPDEFALTSLRNYIDYKRSYPNADGKLLRSKPLFYEKPILQLFFNKRYVYHMLENWKSYLGLPAISGNLEIIVKDPAENNDLPNPSPNPGDTRIPRAMIGWARDLDPQMPADIRAVRNLAFGSSCLSDGGEEIKPASTKVDFVVEHLKPLKLYTALFYSNFDGQRQEIHQYPFQTSRYPNFRAQIQSYQLEDVQGNTRNALFHLVLNLENGLIENGRNIVKGLDSVHSPLAAQYPDPFERLLQGLWQVAALDPPQGTEVNLLLNPEEQIVGLWIRNPEAFNDPKLPLVKQQESIEVYRNGQKETDYEILLSKDGAEAVIMRQSGLIPATGLSLTFHFLNWNGSEYSAVDSESINL